MDRRDFLARLAVLVPAISVIGQYRTHEQNERLRKASFGEIEKQLHPMRYARVRVEIDSNGKQEGFYETAPSPDGPWQSCRKLSDPHYIGWIER